MNIAIITTPQPSTIITTTTKTNIIEITKPLNRLIKHNNDGQSKKINNNNIIKSW